MFPVVTSHYATSILEHLNTQGIDTQLVISRSGLPTELNESGASFLPLSTVENLISETFKVKGYALANRIIQSVIRTHIVPQLLQDCPTGSKVGEAIDLALSNIQTQLPNAQVSLSLTPTGVSFSRFSPFMPNESYKCAEVFSLWVMIELIRATTGDRLWLPQLARVQSETDNGIYACFDSSIQFFHSQPHSSIWFDIEILNRTCRFNAMGVNDKRKVENEISGGNIGQIFSALRPYVLDLDFNLDKASLVSSVSKRTLQRRLKQHGLTFRSLRDNLIADIALEQLETGLSVSSVAVNLGYASISQFSRAFKRITGIAPSKVSAKAHHKVAHLN
ncbi:helix-turn-helix domain-containing protein [Vibrio astriarenae]|uniref:helix-turn-helix domain-containing protein n=1 Tax=Vibrio astriarenae TaxID=1481923 RepID=UPI0037363990